MKATMKNIESEINEKDRSQTPEITYETGKNEAEEEARKETKREAPEGRRKMETSQMEVQGENSVSDHYALTQTS